MTKSKKPHRLVLIAVCAVAGLSYAEAQQPLLNFPSQQVQEVAPTPIPASANQAPVRVYAPQEPLANSDPGVLEPPAIIARGLNEDDASYTTRMQSVQTQLLQERDSLLRKHEEAMKRVGRIGGAGNPTAASPQPAQQNSR